MVDDEASDPGVLADDDTSGQAMSEPEEEAQGSTPDTEDLDEEPVHPAAEKAPPVVGIGASAGGFTPLRTLIDAVPDDTGVAFVIVQHLSPDHKSQLASLLADRNLMPVLEIEDGMEVKANHVYTIPSESFLDIENGRLRLEPRTGEGHQNVIDRFLESLAEDQGSRAVGILLSGTMADGVIGLKEIRQAGGVTIVQDPKTAQFPGMPQAAIDADAVDLVLGPDQIGEELSRLSQHPYLHVTPRRPGELPEWDGDLLGQVFRKLRQATSLEFEHYKETTVHRRILRRMMTIGSRDLEEYLERLESDPEEVDKLHEELLILTTRFFRSEAFFEELHEEILPAIVERRSVDDPIRIWVAGCSTGQEAYSIAIELEEVLAREGEDIPYRVFATDVSAKAIETAREGLYPASIESEVPTQRLQRYFERVEGGYRVNKSIRGNCIFAEHDLTRDPPFADIDLVSCRNVIIYLDNVLQERALGMFHYALGDDGWLALGKSESVSRAPDLFRQTGDEVKVYRPRSVAGHVLQRFAVPTGSTPTVHQPGIEQPDQAPHPDLADEADRLLLDRFAPPAIVVNSDMEIVSFRGDTGPYLQNPEGRATFHLVKLAREGLGSAIGTAIEEVAEEGQRVTYEDVAFVHKDQPRTVDLDVVPMAGPPSADRGFLVVFREEEARARDPGTAENLRDAAVARVSSWLTPVADEEEERIQTLQEELASTREYLRSLSERYEATTEELRSANEEALSTNEELQSTNEELETAKEELQATNEELVTLNDELQERNERIQRINDDLVNLLNSVRLPIVMLDPDLKVRRFTPHAEELLNVIDGDVGRPLTDLNLPLDVQRLEDLMLDVLDNLQVEERTIEDIEGEAYRLRIHPYRTSQDKIDGVVLVFLQADPRGGGERVLGSDPA